MRGEEAGKRVRVLHKARAEVILMGNSTSEDFGLEWHLRMKETLPQVTVVMIPL